MKFNQELASIHAYLCADGYVIRNPPDQKHKYYHIGLRNTNLILLNDFKNKFKKIFGIKPHITNDGRCRVQNKEVYYILTKTFSYYSDKWTLPRLSRKNLREWLRSFFDCEAWVYVKEHQDRHIGLDSINKKGIEEIRKALLKFEIQSRLKFINKKSIYRLYIYGKNNLINFNMCMGFLHKEKNKKLKEAINSYMKYVWEFKNFEDLFKRKARFREKLNAIRLTSKLEENLKNTRRILREEYNIKSKIYKRINGYKTVYYELAIYGKRNINILKDKLGYR